MAKTWVATSVNNNHDWDFDVDNSGNITALWLKGVVTYSDAGEKMVISQRYNIWPDLTNSQKTLMQTIFTRAQESFNSKFLS